MIRLVEMLLTGHHIVSGSLVHTYHKQLSLVHDKALAEMFLTKPNFCLYMRMSSILFTHKESFF